MGTWGKPTLVQKCIGTGLSVKGNNKRKAEKMMRDTLAEWEAKITVNYENIAFGEYLSRWLEEIRHGMISSAWMRRGTYCTPIM